MRTLLLCSIFALTFSMHAAQNCVVTSKGWQGLPDLAGDSYLGAVGGLYGAGISSRPPAHDTAGLQQALQVVPRGPGGSPNPTSGKIVLLSIGMSNTTMEYSSFVAQAAMDPLKSPQVVLVDGAQGGQSIDAIKNPAAAFWTIVDQRIAAAGCTGAQVQAVWIKEAYGNPSQHQPPFPAFPAWTETMADDLTTIVQILKGKFPHLYLGYLSSRTYAGYATTQLNPEPWAYESAWGVKTLIQRQIDGAAELAYDASAGPAMSPWLAWGPYLWTDGLAARSDELVWTCADVTSDGTHPSPNGRTKVANQLAAFFKSDTTARRWYVANPGPSCAPQAEWSVYGTGAAGTSGAPRLVASSVPTVPTYNSLEVHAYGALPGSISAFASGFASYADGQVPLFGGSLLVQPVAVKGVVTSAWGKAWWNQGVIPQQASLCGAKVWFQFGSADPSAVGGFVLSRGLEVRLGH